MPPDIALKAMNGVHRLIVAASRGKLGWEAMGMPVLEITTIGRRTGKARSVLLTSPLRENGHPVLVASRGGDDTHPAWLLNLRANPRVEVALQGGPRRPMTARVATPAERARMWPQITGRYPNYAAYQRRTDREIPLVILEPVAAVP
jgi:deazaflavin-dependent oxidoreductase (nitroreductase family)